MWDMVGEDSPRQCKLMIAVVEVGFLQISIYFFIYNNNNFMGKLQ